MGAPVVIRKQRKGIAVIMTTLSMFLIVPIVGLGIDVSTLYIIRAKLFEAVDAASLAGARALAKGSTSGAQSSNAQAAATKFFNANFPDGFWGVSGITLDPPAVDDASVPNYRTVSVSAHVDAPLYFLRILGQNTSQIGVSSQAARRDALVMLVLDRSSSMNYPFQGSSACQIMKPDAVQFLTNFASGRDMVGLVVFGSSVFVSPPRVNFDQPDANGDTIDSLINQINCTGNTNTVEGMEQAYQELQAVNSTTRANVIVLMTDGRPNGFTGDYTNFRLNPTACDATNSPLIGVLAQWAGGPVSSGPTAGLMNYTTNSITKTNEGATANSTGCAFAGDLSKVSNDISGMPATDIYGNSTSGSYSAYNANSPYGGASVSLTGKSTPAQIEIASVNALDNECIKIRTDAVLKPSIYTLAVEGNSPGDPPDTLLLRKLANDPTMQNDSDPSARIYYQQQVGQPNGYFADAPDPSQIFAAFDTIATQIVVRLAR